MFKLKFTTEAADQFHELKNNPARVGTYKQVRKTLGYLQTNPRPPSLNTHKYNAIQGQNGEEIFEAYAQNRTPGAYRVFWHYGPDQKQITVVAITPHP